MIIIKKLFATLIFSSIITLSGTDAISQVNQSSFVKTEFREKLILFPRGDDWIISNT